MRYHGTSHVCVCVCVYVLQVDILVTFSNQAHVHLNLTSIQGSVNSPIAFNSYIENLTAVEYDTLVAPGKEATLKYTFKPNAALVGRKFQLAHVLTYKTGQYVMHKTVFNSTVNFTEPRTSLFDSTTLLLLIQLLGIISVGGFYGMKELEKRGLLKLDKKEVKEVKTRKPEDWLPGSFMAAQDKSFDAPRSPKSPGKGKKRS